MLYDEALDSVSEELQRQESKWGITDHYDGTYLTAKPLSLVTSDTAVDLRNMFQRQCDAEFKIGYGTWMGILREEMFEAFAESDPDRLYEELIQVAAVAVNWASAIRRRNA